MRVILYLVRIFLGILNELNSLVVNDVQRSRITTMNGKRIRARRGNLMTHFITREFQTEDRRERMKERDNNIFSQLRMLSAV